jgi:hypothetical protein
MRIARLALPLVLLATLVAGPLATDAGALSVPGDGPRIERKVHCNDKVIWARVWRFHTWIAMFSVRNYRPHPATVYGGWTVRSVDGERTVRRHADLQPGEIQWFSLRVDVPRRNAPTIALLGCH